jgi:hypothetical protein
MGIEVVYEFVPSQAQFIDLLYFLVPAISGLILAGVGLYKKFPTDYKIALDCLSGKSYLALSAFGAWLFTSLMRSMGVNIIENSYLNCILMGLLGAGIFLGIISRFAAKNYDEDLGVQLKTLSDYIYESLEDSIKRQVAQTKQLQIQEFIDLVDKKKLQKNADTLINIIHSLDDKGKQELRVKFDKFYISGDFSSIVLELTNYFNIPFLKQILITKIDSSEELSDKETDSKLAN